LPPAGAWASAGGFVLANYVRTSSHFHVESAPVFLYSDIETGEETLAITIFAPTQREAIQIARKRLQSSPVLRKITYAAFTAVEVEK